MQNKTLNILFKCLDQIRLFDEQFCIEGIMSGRQVARLLTQLIPLTDDEDFWRIANAEADNDIPNYALNWQTLKPMLINLLNSTEFDVNLLDLWDGGIYEIIRGDVDQIINLLIYLIISAFQNEGQSRTKIEEAISNLSEEERNELTQKINKIFKLIENKKVSKDINEYKEKIAELCSQRDKYIKENEKLRSTIIELSISMESNKKDEDELNRLKNDINEKEMKILFFENNLNSIKTEAISSQKFIQQLEINNEKLKNQLEIKEANYNSLYKEKISLNDEYETLRASEIQLTRNLKEAKKKIKLLERDSLTVLEKEKEISFMQSRLDHLVKELASKEALQTKLDSIEQIRSNDKLQLKELQTSLSKALLRANDAELQLANLQQQIKKEQSFRFDELTIPYESNFGVTLQDDLSNSNLSFPNEFDSSLRDVAEWKAKYESLEAHNTQLLKELHNIKKLNENAESTYTIKIEKERNEAEKMEIEQNRLKKEVSKIKMENEFLINENNSLKEKNSSLTKLNEFYKDKINDSSNVIRAYSDGQDSPVENSKLRAENEYLRKELELSKLKTDQLKHESCQEQRLITNNWYQNALFNFGKRMISLTPLSSSINSNKLIDENQRQKTFIEKQMEISEFTASFSARNTNNNNVVNLDKNLVLFDANSINVFKKISWKRVFIFLSLLCFFITAFAVVNYEYCIYINSLHKTCTLFGHVPEFQVELVRSNFY